MKVARFVVYTLAALAPYANARALRPEADPGPADTTPYAAGLRALNQERWPDAVAAFSRAAATHDRRADAALYWKAYSLSKLGKPGLSLATCQQLHATYTASSWNRDCSALLLTGRSGQSARPDLSELQQLVAGVRSDAINTAELSRLVTEVGNVRAETLGLDTQHRDPDADLKLLALNSLMNRDPAQALPILRSLLTGNQSPEFKQHALFVLSQNNSPEAQRLMHDLVVGHTDPALQRQAIEMLGVSQGKRAGDTLEEVYRNTSSTEVRSAVVSSLFVSGDATRMVRLAREEKDLDRKRDIVSKLALMQDKAATDYMLELLK